MCTHIYIYGLGSVAPVVVEVAPCLLLVEYPRSLWWWAVHTIA